MKMNELPSEHSEERKPEEKEKDLTAAMKVVQIMQVISEELGDEEKKMWQKMLCKQLKPEYDEGSI